MRRDDGDGYLREVFKSSRNVRGETAFSVSVIQSQDRDPNKTEREGRVLEGASAETMLDNVGSTRSWRLRRRWSVGLVWI